MHGVRSFGKMGGRVLLRDKVSNRNLTIFINSMKLGPQKH